MRLEGEDIEPGGAELPGGQGFDKSGLVDDFAPGDIDERAFRPPATISSADRRWSNARSSRALPVVAIPRMR
jgi:hypothetical protein